MEQAEKHLRERFGLSSYEARAYLSLVRAPSSAKDLSASAAVPMPRVYDILRRLEEKGFVRKEGGAYSAVEPGLALHARQLRQRRAFEDEYAAAARAKDELVALLRPVQGRGDDGGKEPVLLKGIDSIVAAFLDALGRSDEIVIAVRKGLRMKSAFRSYLETFPASGKRMRLLLPGSPALSRSDRRFLSGIGVEVQTYPRPMFDVMVADESDVILGVPDKSTDEPFSAIGLWIRDHAFAKSVKAALDEIWASES